MNTSTGSAYQSKWIFSLKSPAAYASSIYIGYEMVRKIVTEWKIPYHIIY
jgi:hypothetical protein